MAAAAQKNKGAAACPQKSDARKVAGLYFKRLNDRYLITNDWGQHALLSPADFSRFIKGRLPVRSPLWQDLQTKGFIRDHLDFENFAKEYKKTNAFLWHGPSLHILVTTLRCNQKCRYCHSSSVGQTRTDTDMSLATARSAVDLIFQSPNPNLVIEFQGGEPLLNWPVVRFATQYARARNQAEKRNLLISLVSNMSLLDKPKLNLLLDHEVALCTSLDGPQGLHDQNRLALGGGSYIHAARWIKELQRQYAHCNSPRRRIFKPSALMTTTRMSLSRGQEIVDEYVRLGLTDIFIRPLSPIGYAKKVWPQIGYSAPEFLKFYGQVLDYILRLNQKGKNISERTAALLLTKILHRGDPGFVDLRSPCGAAVGQLAYNFNGDIYTCDEGRMVAHQGDDIFKVGRIGQHSYARIMDSPACRVLCAASNLDDQPACSRCAYKPYCGVCPVHNYEAQHSIWGQIPSSDYCAVHMGIFDLLFERMKNPAHMKIFQSWIKPKQPEGHAPAHHV